MAARVVKQPFLGSEYTPVEKDKAAFHVIPLCWRHLHRAADKTNGC